MDNNLEYNFLLNEQRANNLIRGFVQQQVSELMAVVHNQRLLIHSLEERDREINLRLQALGEENKTIVEHSLIS